MGAAEARPLIGFACRWEDIPERTGSDTPWNLREALRSVTDTTDTGFQIPRLSRTVLKSYPYPVPRSADFDLGFLAADRGLYRTRAAPRAKQEPRRASLRCGTDVVTSLPPPFLFHSSSTATSATTKRSRRSAVLKLMRR